MEKLSSFRKKPGIIFCAAAVALALIFSCFFNFRTHVNAYIDEDMRSQIEAIQKNSTQLVQSEMNDLKRLTASMALMFSRMDIRTDGDILQALKDYADTADIVRTLFITLDGRAYTSYAGYLGQNEAHTAIDGVPLAEIKGPIFSRPYYAEELEEVIFGVIAPTKMGDKQGVLISSYNVENFSRLLENKFIDGSAEIGILNSKGEVVSGKSTDEFMLNIFDLMGSISFQSSTVEIMRSDFAAGRSGFAIYRVDGIWRYCTYAPVELNDWYVVVMVRESSLRSKLMNLERYGIQLTLELVVIMLGLLCVIIASRRGEQKRIRGILEQAAMLDGLTGIYNRKAAEEMIERSLRSGGAESGAALFVLDLDDFKRINDQGGHLFGDNVLKECAGRLKDLFGDDSVIGRVGGDEFVVFIRDSRDMERIEERVNGLIEHFYIQTDAGEKLKISISVGVAKAGIGASSFSELYQLADAALYRAKHTGKSRLSD